MTKKRISRSALAKKKKKDEERALTRQEIPNMAKNLGRDKRKSVYDETVRFKIKKLYM